MQENYEYRGFSLRIFTRGLTRRDDAGLYAVDIWISICDPNGAGSNWTIFAASHLPPSRDPIRLQHDALKAVHLHIDALLIASPQ